MQTPPRSFVAVVDPSVQIWAYLLVLMYTWLDGTLLQEPVRRMKTKHKGQYWAQT